MTSSPSRSGSWRIVLVLLALGGPAFAQKTPDIRLDTGSPPGAAASDSPRVAASDSAVYVVWTDVRDGAGDVYFNRSLDGGATWLPSDVRLDTGSAPGAASSTAVQLAAAGASVYVTWSDDRNSHQGTRDVYFNRSLDGGSTWLASAVRLDVGSAPGAADSVDPQVTASGASVYVTWSDNRNDPTGTNEDIYFNRSLDAGANWLSSAVRLDVGDPAGGSRSRFPEIAVAGSAVYVTWMDERNSIYDIYFNRSLDAGANWLLDDRRLDRGGPSNPGFSHHPEIAAAGSSVYVTWADDRDGLFPGSSDIYFNRSLDAGATWLANDVRLDVGDPPGNAPSASQQIAAAGASVYVTWVDLRHELVSPNIYFNRSLDGGATWLPADVRLDLNSPPGLNPAYRPQISAAGAAVQVVWTTNRVFVGALDIFLNRSLSAGETWLPTAVRLDIDGAQPNEDSRDPTIALSGSSVYVVWQDQRNGVGRDDIYFNLALGFQPYGQGTPGKGGIVPTIGGSGDASIGGTFSVDVANGLGGAAGALLVGPNGPASIPAEGGAILVQPPYQTLPFQLGGEPGTAGAGSTSIPFPIPNQLSLLGTRMNFQARIFEVGRHLFPAIDPRRSSSTGGLEAWIL